MEPNPLADGCRFAEALRASALLPAQAQGELLGFDVRWRLTAEGALLPRRGVVLKVTGPGSRRRMLALRRPGGRVLRWRLPG